MAESYDVGTRAWQADPTEGWVASELVKKTAEGTKTTLVFKLDNGEVCFAPFEQFGDLVRFGSRLLTDIFLDTNSPSLHGGFGERQ
jgi:hypothetical protein